MGVALAAVKERLRGGCDAQRLVAICLHTVGHLSATQLAGWRNHCRRLVSEEHVRLDAKRRLVKLQHASGFSWQEVLLLARHCGLRLRGRAQSSSASSAADADVRTGSSAAAPGPGACAPAVGEAGAPASGRQPAQRLHAAARAAR